MSVLSANVSSAYDARTSCDAPWGTALGRQDRDAVSEESGKVCALGL